MNLQKLRPLYAIVAHDAGGAELLSSYVLNSGVNAIYTVAGPAVSVFDRKLKVYENLGLEEAVRAADIILLGTSIPSDWEKRGLMLAHALEKKYVSVLDHWINYKERFDGIPEFMLPEEIWVFDDFAHALATQLFPRAIVLQKENFFKLDSICAIEDETNNLVLQPLRSPKTHILYVTQPISAFAEYKYGDPNYFGYNEYDALELFFRRIPEVISNCGGMILRPHPSEDVAKYDYLLKRYQNIEIRSNYSLAREIAVVDVVVGCNSMAMVVGGWASRRVLCSIPKNGRGFRLPFPFVENLD